MELSSHVERDLRAKLRTIQEEVITLNHTQNSEEELRAVERIKSNPKAFYAHANKSRKIRTKIGPLKIKENGHHHYESDPKKMAEILSNQYESVFSIPTTRKTVNTLPEHDSLNDVIVTPRAMKDVHTGHPYFVIGRP